MLMHLVRQHPVFASLIGTALLGMVVLSATMTVLAIVNHRTKMTLKQRQHELRTLAAAGLLLSDAEAKLAAEKVSALERQNAELFARDSASSRQTAIENIVAPTTPTDAFFEIAAFVERMAAQARSFGVRTASDERFGFAAYAKSGPEPELIPVVLKQQEIVERVLSHLFAARPERLLSITRESPAKPGRIQTNAVSTSAADLFAFSPRQAVRAEGELTTAAVQVAFVGDTAVLRNFLTAMGEPGSRLLVRSVEADAMSQGSVDDGVAVHASGSPHATIGQRTKFTVVIEAFEFVRPLVPAALSS